MIKIRHRNDRGATQTGWLDSRHTFSFGHYRDPANMGFRTLRVINEDRVAPGAGFPPHSHQNMEIISYVLAGALEHKDSLGTGSVIRPGQIQRMSAGSGITHSEYNHSGVDPVHFLQIWIEPGEAGRAPSYEQKTLAEDEKRGRFALIGGPEGGEGAVKIHQDARLYLAELAAGEGVEQELPDGRHGWLQVTRGIAELDGHELRAGDGAALSDERRFAVKTAVGAELLLFDLA